MRSGESFGMICHRDQLEKMERVVVHNGGVMSVQEERADGVVCSVEKKD